MSGESLADADLIVGLDRTRGPTKDGTTLAYKISGVERR